MWQNHQVHAEKPSGACGITNRATGACGKTIMGMRGLIHQRRLRLMGIWQENKYGKGGGSLQASVLVVCTQELNTWYGRMVSCQLVWGTV